MLASNNVLSPATATDHRPSQDIVLGLYLHDREKINAKGEGTLVRTDQRS